MGDLVETQTFEEHVRSTVDGLVNLRAVGRSFYINLPMATPDGSFITVRVDQAPGGVRVSDCGFAYREAEDVGSSKSFMRTANRIASENGVEVSNHAVCIDVPLPQMHRAVCDVAEVSWKIMDHICRRAFDAEEDDLAGSLSERLVTVFGSKVRKSGLIAGSSTFEWPMSAVVDLDEDQAVFQAVSGQPNSINKASTAFRDLSLLKKRPRLVAFVRTREDIGKKLALLSPGKVVEADQTDDLLMKAVA